MLGWVAGAHETLAPADQPVRLMGPPVLVDNASAFAIAEMPATGLYLREKLSTMRTTCWTN